VGATEAHDPAPFAGASHEGDVTAAALEAALVARGAVRRGRHLRLRCPFPDHADQHPSCDYDPIKQVFYCRACHRGGGWMDLAERLELVAPRPRRRLKSEVPLPLGTAEGIETLRRQRERLEDYQDLFAIADWIRLTRPVIQDVRRQASALGDVDEVWPALARAAALETLTSALEVDWEEVMRHG
jgi:CHC2 zinc finger